MTDTHAALLAAVLAHPDQDTPRLALADYLDDHGGDEGAAWAAFIRVGVELARYGGECSGPCNRELCRRCHALQEEGSLAASDAINTAISRSFPDGWYWTTESLPIRNTIAHAVVHRGFVESVACPAADWLAHADAILAANPVRRVRLADRPVIEGEGDDVSRWLRVEGREKWYRVPYSVRTGELTAHVLGLEWPGIAFVLPAPGLEEMASAITRRILGEPYAMSHRVAASLTEHQVAEILAVRSATAP